METRNRVIDKTYQYPLRVAYPPSQVLDITVGFHDSRGKLDPKPILSAVAFGISADNSHMVDSKDDPVGVFAVSFDQRAIRLVNGAGCDVGVLIEAVLNDR